MKLHFEEQPYQLAAVDSVVRVFDGQPRAEGMQYQVASGVQGGLGLEDEFEGVRNAEIVPEVASQLRENIQKVQGEGHIARSERLHSELGACQLDVEMETGTGKTYVYTRTILELHEKYGWCKFIIVVPSVAIREGVRKSLSMTEEHFRGSFRKKLRYFVYDSKSLQKVDGFARASEPSVMIINMQAFNSDVQKRGRTNASRIIHSEQDTFGSRRPIDVIAAMRPILILDEPQKMGGRKTQEAMKAFNPLFTLSYSATHRDTHNLVYVLDALDAYNERLVKRIEVVGLDLKNIQGTSAYLRLAGIKLSTGNPVARLEMDVREKGGIRRRIRNLSAGADLYDKSGELMAYKGYVIKSISDDPELPERSGVEFTNGKILRLKETRGDFSAEHRARIQIRETIDAHFRKEEALFLRGVKCLSLFFLDRVENYRKYDAAGQERLGCYGEIFVEEYEVARSEKLESLAMDSAYREYLARDETVAIHAGYFSVDRKGRAIDSQEKKKEGGSDDVSAYDLILRDKERLLSLEEPVRFIFSHSALREGWDNPNVFQICSFHQSQSATRRRQEVGRGLRLCVDAKGRRLDSSALGREGVHALNRLTVVASESYADFAKGLQKELEENLYSRPKALSVKVFRDMVVPIKGGEPYRISEEEANRLHLELFDNGYIDKGGDPTDKYHADRREGHLTPLEGLPEAVSEAVYERIERIFSGVRPEELVENAAKPEVENKLNANFEKKEFQALWERIHQRQGYRVEFDSEELIAKCIEAIDRELRVPTMEYRVERGEQKAILSQEEMHSKGMMALKEKGRPEKLVGLPVGGVRYDLLGEIARPTFSCRRTVARILMGIRRDKFAMYAQNPEYFFREARRIITEQRATLIVDHITYNLLNETYESSIFTDGEHAADSRAIRGKKSITDYVFWDSDVERQFAQELDAASEVVAYAKLPRGFHIPTPLGDYSPDWAIAFEEGAVRHIYFVAETKGSMSSLDLRRVEDGKIKCARQFFEKLSKGVRYDVVDSYEALRELLA
ncbi:MAG: restriction endonuclease subunit R [Bacteroidetes bacterium]|nr:MAG: restriction endonuclease subunit R [Bacteroidota bacterium]